MLAAYSRCSPSFFIFCCCFMPLMKASRLAFVLILPFFPIRERNATVCIRPWYFLRCRTLTGAVMKRLPAISFLSYFSILSLSRGKFLTSFCRHQSLGQSLSPYLRAFLRTWRAALVSLLCRGSLIKSALFVHTRKTTVHVQVLKEAAEASLLRLKKWLFWMGGQMLLSCSIHLLFFLWEQ